MKKYTITFPENYEKPKLEYRDRWCAALRSGEYKQGQSFLKSEALGSYCCLGVLCEVEGLEILRGQTVISLDCERLYKDLNGTGYFPNGVSVSTGRELYYSLAGVNDSCKLSFLDIVDIIEAVWD